MVQWRWCYEEEIKRGNYSSNRPKGELFVFTLNTYWNAVMHSNKCDYYYNPQGDTKDFHFHLTVAKVIMP